MAELLLIVRIAGERVAVAAADVESVVEIDALTPIPRAARHVAGLAALRSRVLTVIDCTASLDGDERREAVRDAIVVVTDGHPYALLVDGIDDVVESSAEMRPLRTTLAPAWQRVGRGMVEADGDLLLLVDAQALIAGPGQGACRAAS